MGTHLKSSIWGPFWVFGSPFEAQECVKSQCSHVDHLIICESKISFNEFHASLQWNWYLYFKTFYYKELVCRLASGVLSNIDHQKKTRISTKYRPHSTLSTKYRPQNFLKKRILSKLNCPWCNMMCHVLRFICMLSKGCHPVWFVVVCCSFDWDWANL